MAFGYYPVAWGLSMSLELPPSQRLVLLALCERANDEGACYPSQARLALDTGLSPRTVRKALSMLEDLHGLIERHARYLEGTNARTSDLIFLRITKKELRRDGLRPEPAEAEPCGLWAVAA